MKKIYKLCDTYEEQEYGDVVESIVVIEDDDNIILLYQEDLEKIADVIHARFVAI